MKHTPLTEVHRKLKAKMVDFHGFEMPVQYAGVIGEHKTVRAQVGLFDLCHMGEFELTGPTARDSLSYVSTNDPSTLQEGQIQYTILTDDNGCVIDDILAYKTAEGYYLVVNASNIDKDYAWIKQHIKEGTNLRNVSDDTALIAIQGPGSAEVVEKVFAISVSDVKNYTFFDHTYEGGSIRISRTGYTGEDGFELYSSNDQAVPLWEKLMEAGASQGIQPIGLGARDTLRLEMRMPLYGNDIDDTTTPLEAGLGRFVKLDKGDFIGRDVLATQKEEGIRRKLVAFTMIDKGIPRNGYSIVNDAGEEVGYVTSGTHSPSLGYPIGMGYVPVEMSAPDTVIDILIRNKPAHARIIKGRFLK